MGFELWMKIAFVAMAVMSVLGLVAFIIVLHHVIPRPFRPYWPRARECKLNKFEAINMRIDAVEHNLGKLNDRQDEFNSDMSRVNSHMELYHDKTVNACNKLDSLQRRIEELDERMDVYRDRAFETGAEISALKTSLSWTQSVDVKKLKKRVKTLEKKEG